MLGELSRGLRNDMRFWLHGTIIRDVPFLKKQSRDFLK